MRVKRAIVILLGIVSTTILTMIIFFMLYRVLFSRYRFDYVLDGEIISFKLVGNKLQILCQQNEMSMNHFEIDMESHSVLKQRAINVNVDRFSRAYFSESLRYIAVFNILADCMNGYITDANGDKILEVSSQILNPKSNEIDKFLESDFGYMNYPRLSFAHDDSVLAVPSVTYKSKDMLPCVRIYSMNAIPKLQCEVVIECKEWLAIPKVELSVDGKYLAALVMTSCNDGFVLVHDLTTHTDMFRTSCNIMSLGLFHDNEVIVSCINRTDIETKSISLHNSACTSRSTQLSDNMFKNNNLDYRPSVAINGNVVMSYSGEKLAEAIAQSRIDESLYNRLLNLAGIRTAPLSTHICFLRQRDSSISDFILADYRNTFLYENICIYYSGDRLHVQTVIFSFATRLIMLALCTITILVTLIYCVYRYHNIPIATAITKRS